MRGKIRRMSFKGVTSHICIRRHGDPSHPFTCLEKSKYYTMQKNIIKLYIFDFEIYIFLVIPHIKKLNYAKSSPVLLCKRGGL